MIRWNKNCYLKEKYLEIKFSTIHILNYQELQMLKGVCIVESLIVMVIITRNNLMYMVYLRNMKDSVLFNLPHNSKIGINPNFFSKISRLVLKPNKTWEIREFE